MTQRGERGSPPSLTRMRRTWPVLECRLAAVCAPQRGLCARSVAVAEKFGAQPALVQGLNVLEVGCGCGFRHPPRPAPPTPTLSRSTPRPARGTERGGAGSQGSRRRRRGQRQ